MLERGMPGAGVLAGQLAQSPPALPDRVKVWLACDAHRDHLEGYLASRGFPVVVTALDVVADVVPDRA
ncbi:hypothetical protein GCM10025881_00250 [Pseudolysinimonas kribbensis]|uniref:Uncharacterized protein n=1 Tax=Pseudolysinimonas kribbensis TaxID=433641 RepID=A0ABQ6K371_9MICO|nr:hypothetical protein GCM10025881_00250 [Pseudolysinimonas kribbensis]